MRIAENQITFCQQRLALLGGVIPKHSRYISEEAIVNLGKPRFELSWDNGDVVCDLYIGRARVESFYLGDFCPAT